MRPNNSYSFIDPDLTRERTRKMKTNLTGHPEEVLTILRASLCRLNLPTNLVEELIERHIAVAFQKDALVFCEGNTDGMLACILSGYVNVYCPVGDGDRTLVRMAGPGEIIGYPDYVDEKGRHARLFEAQAASKCTLALFSCEHVARLLAALPADALISILTALNTFWSENLRFFAILLNLPNSDRLTMVLSDLAQRAGARDSEGIILIPEIGQEDLAEMIGCSRPLVSRLIAEMVESGLLTRRGRQYVLLKNWDFNQSNRSPHKAIRRLHAIPPGRSSTFAVGSPKRRVVAS